jgi:uncharacterized protein YbaA (DUF1428 family)
MQSDAYVDGFLLAVPTANKEAYRQLVLQSVRSFKKHGALELIECWGDDVPEGKLTSMPMAVQCQADETVVFAWIVWPSREVRDAGMKAVMEDPDAPGPHNMPFDAKRMIFGGFRPLVAS